VRQANVSASNKTTGPNTGSSDKVSQQKNTTDKAKSKGQTKETKKTAKQKQSGKESEADLIVEEGLPRGSVSQVKDSTAPQNQQQTEVRSSKDGDQPQESGSIPAASDVPKEGESTGPANTEHSFILVCDNSYVLDKVEDDLDWEAREFELWTQKLHIFFRHKFFPAAQKYLMIDRLIENCD